MVAISVGMHAWGTSSLCSWRLPEMLRGGWPVLNILQGFAHIPHLRPQVRSSPTSIYRLVSQRSSQFRRVHSTPLTCSGLWGQVIRNATLAVLGMDISLSALSEGRVAFPLQPQTLLFLLSILMPHLFLQLKQDTGVWVVSFTMWTETLTILMTCLL